MICILGTSSDQAKPDTYFQIQIAYFSINLQVTTSLPFKSIKQFPNLLAFHDVQKVALSILGLKWCSKMFKKVL
jgi:hypothetical protein